MRTKIFTATRKEWLVVTDGTNILVEDKDYLLTRGTHGLIVESNRDDIVCYLLLLHNHPTWDKKPTIVKRDNEEVCVDVENLPQSEGFVHFKKLIETFYPNHADIKKRWAVAATVVVVDPVEQIKDAISKLDSNSACELQTWLDEYVEHLVILHENNTM